MGGTGAHFPKERRQEERAVLHESWTPALSLPFSQGSGKRENAPWLIHKGREFAPLHLIFCSWERLRLKLTCAPPHVSL